MEALSSIASISNAQRIRRKNAHSVGRHGSTSVLASTSNNLEDASVAPYSHHRSNSIAVDGHSVTADEGSESVLHIRPRVKNPRHTKLINTIVLWVKNVNKMRAMQICKAFYTWKHCSPGSTSNDSSAENTKAAAFSDQKSSYLQLFTENEKLREQMFEIKKVMKQNEKYMRYASMKTLLSTIVRKKMMNKVRYYYDIWFHNVRMMRMTAETRVRTMELEIGLQQIASEQDSMTRYKHQNHVLSMSLATMIFFFKWKNKTILSLLAAERHKYALQQNTLLLELKRLKEKIIQSNNIEREYLQKGLQRGEQKKEELQWLAGQLQTLLTQSRNAHSAIPGNNGTTHANHKKSSHHKKTSSNSSVASTASTSASITTPLPDHSTARKLFPLATAEPSSSNVSRSRMSFMSTASRNSNTSGNPNLALNTSPRPNPNSGSNPSSSPNPNPNPNPSTLPSTTSANNNNKMLPTELY